MSEPLIPIEDLGVTIDPDFYEVEVGDLCSNCETTVKSRWSGISCDCGRVWHCL